MLWRYCNLALIENSSAPVCHICIRPEIFNPVVPWNLWCCAHLHLPKTVNSTARVTRPHHIHLPWMDGSLWRIHTGEGSILGWLGMRKYFPGNIGYCSLPLIYPLLQRSWKGVYWFYVVRLSGHLSVCMSVDGIMSTLYLQQYSLDPFYIYTFYQAASEGVSLAKFVA